MPSKAPLGRGSLHVIVNADRAQPGSGGVAEHLVVIFMRSEPVSYPAILQHFVTHSDQPINSPPSARNLQIITLLVARTRTRFFGYVSAQCRATWRPHRAVLRRVSVRVSTSTPSPVCCAGTDPHRLSFRIRLRSVVGCRLTASAPGRVPVQ